MTTLRKARTAVLAVLAMVLVLAVTTPDLSTAAFTSSTSSTGTVQAGDWVPPVVSISVPAELRGEATLTARASDPDGSGVASVTIQHLRSGAEGWTTLCVASAPPYSCTWDTTRTANGTHDVRAIAADHAGLTTTSLVASAQVANESAGTTLVLQHPGDPVRGKVRVTARLETWLRWPIVIEYRAAGATQEWQPLCSGTVRTLSCEWDTTRLTDGDYDLRATADVFWVPTPPDIVSGVTVDNTAPTVNMTDPGNNLKGFVTFSATVSDGEGSGVSSVAFQHSPSEKGPWAPVCTAASEPWSCRFDTRPLPNGKHYFRAVATDAAGNTSASTPQQVPVAGPGAGSTRTTDADGTSPARPAGTAPEKPEAPEVREESVEDQVGPPADEPAEAPDEPVVTPVEPEPTAPVGTTPVTVVDVVVRHAEEGRTLGQGDTVTLTYSGELDLTSVLAGWSGDAVAVTVELGKNGTLGVLVDEVPAELGQVTLPTPALADEEVVGLTATMTASTTAVDGLTRTVVALGLNPVEVED